MTDAQPDDQTAMVPPVTGDARPEYLPATTAVLPAVPLAAVATSDGTGATAAEPSTAAKPAKTSLFGRGRSEQAGPATKPDQPSQSGSSARPQPQPQPQQAAATSSSPKAQARSRRVRQEQQPGTIEAKDISAWFGSRKVLDRVSLSMPARTVTALIGPSGCGKSTFLRILNRMHELVPSASLAGEVMLDGSDIYDRSRRVTDARRSIGMVFQKPNPFPAMSIYENVVAGLALSGIKVTRQDKDVLVEDSLRKASLWDEVKDRLEQPGGGLSGGQQQRLCIARSLAVRPRILLMDEPCSALDPTSTNRVEETIHALKDEVTIVIVTHNMQQAARVSNQCAFFLAEMNTPGVIVEYGPTEAMFASPVDRRTGDYVNGRFG